MTPEELKAIRDEIRRDLADEQEGSFFRKFMSSQPKLNGKAMGMIMTWILAINGAGLAGTALYVRWAVDASLTASKEAKEGVHANALLLQSMAEIIARLDERTRKQ